MSASLVGSEMCIRDSLGPRLHRCTSERHPGLHRGALRGALGTQQIPVSYTHLTLPTICSV
eukprot:13339154-Alexandrium_andersonii.AAC.1